MTNNKQTLTFASTAAGRRARQPVPTMYELRRGEDSGQCLSGPNPPPVHDLPNPAREGW